ANSDRPIADIRKGYRDRVQHTVCFRLQSGSPLPALAITSTVNRPRSNEPTSLQVTPRLRRVPFPYPSPSALRDASLRHLPRRVRFVRIGRQRLLLLGPAPKRGEFPRLQQRYRALVVLLSADIQPQAVVDEGADRRAGLEEFLYQA